MRKKLFIVSAILLFASNIFPNGGSVYTRYGLGDLVFTHSARRFALGGLGTSVADVNNISYLNPASIYKIDLTRFEVGMSYNGYSITSEDEKAYYSNYSFSGFALAFPIDKKYGISASIGLAPVTNQKYEVRNRISAAENSLIDEEHFLDYKGDGGLSKFYLGLSYKLPFDFAIGASYEYYTGKTEQNSTVDFDDLSDFNDVTYTLKKSFRGIGTSIGIISGDLSDIVGVDGIENFHVGVSYNYVANLDVDTNLTSSTSIGTIENSKGIVEIEYPSRISTGLSFTYDKNYLILVDYYYQPWSNYKFNGLVDNNLRDFSKISLALEYSQNERRLSSSVWEQMTFRGGLSYEQTQYSINGEDITKYSVFAGLSFPLGPGNTIDLGVEYGARGTIDSNLLKENQFNGFISISFGELWFIRQDR